MEYHCSSPFNLDAQIAALPRCSMDWFTKKKKKKKGGEEGASEEYACRDDRFQSDTDPAKDPDFRPSVGVMRRIRSHQREGTGGPRSPEGTSPQLRGGEERASSSSAAAPNKFRTGDFDLEEHLAALPKCDIEVLSRRRKACRRDSGSGSSRLVSGCASKEVVEEGSAVESDAGSDSTEENGTREEWHTDEDEDDSQPDRRCSRQEAGRLQEEFPNSLAALADIALSQKEKMQD